MSAIQKALAKGAVAKEDAAATLLSTLDAKALEALEADDMPRFNDLFQKAQEMRWSLEQPKKKLKKDRKSEKGDKERNDVRKAPEDDRQDPKLTEADEKALLKNHMKEDGGGDKADGCDSQIAVPENEISQEDLKALLSQIDNCRGNRKHMHINQKEKMFVIASLRRKVGAFVMEKDLTKKVLSEVIVEGVDKGRLSKEHDYEGVRHFARSWLKFASVEGQDLD